MKIKGVLLDLDGTLFDRDAAVRDLLDAQYSEFAKRLSPISRADFTDRVADLDDHGFRDKAEVYERVARECGLPADLAPILVSDFWQRYHRFCRPFPGVLQTLDAYSGHRDHPDRRIVIRAIGHRDRSEATLAGPVTCSSPSPWWPAGFGGSDPLA